MSSFFCPNCEKEIPEYRFDDPYCDCGWSRSKGSMEIEELNWIKLFIVIAIMCFLQIIVLFFSHFTTNISIGFLDSLFSPILDPYLISMLHYLIVFVVDYILLMLIYGGAIFYLSYKKEHSILFSCVIGLACVIFKFFIIDIRSNISYPLLLYILNLLLLISTIAIGIVIDYLNKNKLK